MPDYQLLLHCEALRKQEGLISVVVGFNANDDADADQKGERIMKFMNQSPRFSPPGQKWRRVRKVVEGSRTRGLYES